MVALPTPHSTSILSHLIVLGKTYLMFSVSQQWLRVGLDGSMHVEDRLTEHIEERVFLVFK